MKNRYKVLFFDLDETLLRSDKTLTEGTTEAIRKCKEKGFAIGIATSRSEKNTQNYIWQIQPDILICSGGAVVRYKGRYILVSDYTIEETQGIIRTIREVCGEKTEMTIDTIDNHFWNYRETPTMYGKDWGESTFSDFYQFSEKALKICVNIPNENLAKELSDKLPNCACISFSDGQWYKFARHIATKEYAIKVFCNQYNVQTNEIIAFGDDWADIKMLELCGMGIAVGNAIPEVRAVADRVIKSNDEEGVATFLLQELLD